MAENNRLTVITRTYALPYLGKCALAEIYACAFAFTGVIGNENWSSMMLSIDFLAPARERIDETMAGDE